MKRLGTRMLALGAVLLMAYGLLRWIDAGGTSVPPQSRAEVERGAELFATWGCPTCHGPHGEGTPKGPELRQLSRYWNAETLATYLQHPERLRKNNPRLQQLAAGYAPITMPSLEALDAKARKALVAYLLTL